MQHTRIQSIHSKTRELSQNIDQGRNMALNNLTSVAEGMLKQTAEGGVPSNVGEDLSAFLEALIDCIADIYTRLNFVSQDYTSFKSQCSSGGFSRGFVGSEGSGESSSSFQDEINQVYEQIENLRANLVVTKSEFLGLVSQEKARMDEILNDIIKEKVPKKVEERILPKIQEYDNKIKSLSDSLNESMSKMDNSSQEIQKSIHMDVNTHFGKRLGALEGKIMTLINVVNQIALIYNCNKVHS